MEKEYKSLRDFYPYYQSEHKDKTSRTLHFIGTGLIIPIIFLAIMTEMWWALSLVPLIGYGFAWVGHFFFERNKPATFRYPGYSLASDFIFFWNVVSGKEKLWLQ